MATTNAARHVELEPDRAWALWTDVRRWATFVEGFAHVVERAPDWPAQGSRVVWTSGPGGRGRVTEKVMVSEAGAAFATRIFEEALSGVQTVTFERVEDGRTRVILELDYRLEKGGPLRAVTDVLFIRRALNQALQRTLDRFATEAAEETSL